MQPRTQLYSLIDRLFLVDEEVNFTSKNLSSLKIDNSFMEQYKSLKCKCDNILLKIKNRKEQKEQSEKLK